MWDYLTNTTNDTLPQHFDDLLALCVRRNIKRTIIFIKDPSANSFFDPTNTDANSFISKANTLYNTMSAKVPGFDIAIFFESGGFSSSAPSGTYPTVNPQPDTGLADYFSQIDAMLDWSKAVIAQVLGIKEIAFDPEVYGSTKDIEQLVYNYTEEYKWLNNLGNIRIGTTLGIDESKPTFANLSTFPVNSIVGGSISTFPPNPEPSWTRGSPTSTLLQSVYIQAYQTSIPAMFAAGYNQTAGTHSGALASVYFNKMLRDQPYIAGDGLISFTQNSTTLKGNANTTFLSFADPILYANDTVHNIPNRKLGVVDTVTSNQLLTLDDPGATFTEANSPFTRTEITTSWSFPTPTQSIVNNIYWMFSVNYDPSEKLTFFGNWQLSDFMDFISGTVSINNQASTQPFTTLTFPATNFVIYDYDFSTSIVNTTPTSNGTVQPWSL